MTDWGLHIYSNITSLINKTSADKKGFPWNLSENKHSDSNYQRGTCPVADSLFQRSVLLAIPSCLTERDEEDIIHAFRKVLNHFAKS
jgi:8-amino-3,8-dideoxy-alpha-D-manno-octulosonate transaminase